jgi:hypothetical protein
MFYKKKQAMHDLHTKVHKNSSGGPEFIMEMNMIPHACFFLQNEEIE